MSEYGYFQKEGREFVITTPDTPRHWYNYLFNDQYVTFTSQVGFGEGIVQGYLGRRIMLVDSRQVYISDAETKEFWLANGLPLRRQYESFKCIHGIGYSEISSQYQGIAVSWRLFVPQEAPEEIWTVKVKNNSQQKRTVKVIPYAKTEADGVYRAQGYNVDTAGLREEYNGIATRSYAKIESSQFQEVSAYFLADKKITGYDTRKNAFIGTYGNEQDPDAMYRGGCTGSECNAEKICLVLENTVTLEPGEEAEFHYALGIALCRKELEQAAKRISGGKTEERLEAVKKQYEEEEKGVTIHTPDESLNFLVNAWTKHQTNMGSRWARVRHNGYRDMVSDSECMAAFNPRLAWERFKRALTYQYSSGYAPRTWLDGEIRDNNFADCAVWIPMAAASIVKELGDASFLEEEVEFNDKTSASVYEHVKRAVEFLWNFKGVHGLIKLWGGDWNDMMNQAGLEGKGVSVWLSIAWCQANRQFGLLAEALGKQEDLFFSRIRGQEMKDVINEFGWDGEYYICAINDQGERLGSSECEEGKIYLIPQLWAIMADVADEERKESILKAVDKYLETDLGTLVSWPAYHNYIPTIGQMTQKPAGVHENGGVYLHPCCWKLAVDSMMKDNDKVEMGLKKILPFHHEYHEKKCEPYIMCNSYFNEETGYRLGTAGQTWRSATGAWLTKALLQYVLGLNAELPGLKLEPCLPKDWRECSVVKEFRDSVYEIRFIQEEEGGCNRIKSMTVNGETWESEFLPNEKGMKYQVEVRLSR
ncbi:MAG: hypothetical protein QM657_12540 [Lacrimispora sp.]|uniref:GH36-type glycosyl hydrolase domain-containing protein n=1 Tax=Lacrimispora sp. TaxID=2719234 RepID=UPI0039E3E7A7